MKRKNFLAGALAVVAGALGLYPEVPLPPDARKHLLTIIASGEDIPPGHYFVLKELDPELYGYRGPLAGIRIYGPWGHNEWSATPYSKLPAPKSHNVSVALDKQWL